MNIQFDVVNNDYYLLYPTIFNFEEEGYDDWDLKTEEEKAFKNFFIEKYINNNLKLMAQVVHKVTKNQIADLIFLLTNVWLHEAVKDGEILDKINNIGNKYVYFYQKDNNRKGYITDGARVDLSSKFNNSELEFRLAQKNQIQLLDIDFVYIESSVEQFGNSFKYAKVGVSELLKTLKNHNNIQNIDILSDFKKTFLELKIPVSKLKNNIII